MEKHTTVQCLKDHYSRTAVYDEQSRSSELFKFKLLLKSKGEHFITKAEEHNRLSVTHDDIFEPGGSKEKKPIKRILIEGGAGVGKTAFCDSLCIEWANGKLFQEYDVLLYLPLCQQRLWCAHSLHELIETLNFGVSSLEVVGYTQEKNGKGVLVIADGWNDVDGPYCLKGSFLSKLLFGDALSSASVIVTSRPTASAALHQGEVIDRYIEICGFDDESIELFVKSQFTSDQPKANTLLHQMVYNPLLRSMCSFPITCKYLCHFWRTSDDLLFPSIMAEVCTKVLMNILRCNCQELGTDVSSSSLHELLNALPRILQESWLYLCEVALLSIEDSVYVSQFKCLRYQYGIMTFGLVEYVEKDDDRMSVSFPHPTSQEYLAALHVMKQPPENQIQTLSNVCHKLKHTSLFWKLYVGLSISSDHMSPSVLSQALQMISTNHLPRYLLCHCAFKVQDDHLTKEVIKHLSTEIESNTILQLSDAHNSHDCDTMLYVIDNIKDSKCDGLQINFSECGIGSEQLCRLANILASNSAHLQVIELDLSGNNLPDDKVEYLFSRAKDSFQSLEKLFVRNNKIRHKGITAIMESVSSRSLAQLDISFNSLKLQTGLKCLHNAIKSGRLANLKILLMQGCLTPNAEKNTKFLKALSERILSSCKQLQRLDLYGNAFVTSDVTEIVTRLSDCKIQVTLDDKTFVEIMEDSMKKKGKINHTVVHGVFVGPGRSGKNSLMNRLTGEGPSDPDKIIPSTGVLESVIKVEVKKLCMIASSEKKALQWKRLKYDNEDLELMMATIQSHKTSTKEPPADHLDTKSSNTIVISKRSVPSAKIVSECLTQLEDRGMGASPVKSPVANDELEVAEGYVVHENVYGGAQGAPTSPHAVNSYDGEYPKDLFKRAVKLRRMDALREHFESSWMLYLTNTGGQTEFQELLPILVCGPSVFFVTFPLNKSLDDRYMVRYDGSHESYTYQSSATLMEEILQTLATIEALDRSRTYNKGTLKIFLVGTHKDKLTAEPECSVNDQLRSIDKRLRERVEKTFGSLCSQGSIVFAMNARQLMFTVNNFAEEQTDFYDIQLRLQKEVEECDNFAIECPSTWLIFSLILRAKHTLDNVLSYSHCFNLAKRCCIETVTELHEALSFIHTRLGLVRYFPVEKLNKLIIIDPQILFEIITNFINRKFV